MGEQDRPRIPAAWEQLELITSASADGITIQDRDGRLVYANDAAARMSGFPSAAAFLSAPIEEIVARFEMLDESGDAFPVEELPGRRALRGEPDPEAVVRFRTRPNGEDRWSLIRSTPVRGPDGDVQHAVNVFMDITDDRKRERVQRFLAEAGRELVRSLHWQGTLERVARLAVPDFADWCAVDILEPDGTLALITIAHVDPAKVRWAHELRERFPPDPDAPSGVWNAIRTGRSELIPEITEELIAAADITDPEIFDILERLRLSSIMYVPLIARGRTLGAIEMVWAESGKHYSVEDLEVAEDLATRAALAIDNARLYRERDEIASFLQQSLLPPRLPKVEGFHVAARYRAASTDRVGGDFYDVFETDKGSWALVVGDVCGKGVLAAALMGTARHSIRTAALGEQRPSEVLRILNRAIGQEVTDGRFCTACYVRLRPGPQHARLTVCSAGHPPPVVVRSDGMCAFVGRPGNLIGVFPDVHLFDEVVDLSPGDAFLLYTDGVVDQRLDGEMFGEERLLSALRATAGQPAGDVAANLDRELAAFDPGKANDDVAFVVLTMDPA